VDTTIWLLLQIIPMSNVRIIEAINNIEADLMISTIDVEAPITEVVEEVHGMTLEGMIIGQDSVIMGTVGAAADMPKAIIEVVETLTKVEEVVTEEAATVTTPISRMDTQREAAVRTHHPQIMATQVITANKAAMALLMVVVEVVVGLTVMGIALAQPVTVEEGTVIPNIMNEMLGGVKRVIIQLDTSLAAVAIVTILADTTTAEGISKKNLHFSWECRLRVPEVEKFLFPHKLAMLIPFYRHLHMHE